MFLCMQNHGMPGLHQAPHVRETGIAGRTDSKFAAVKELPELHVLNLAGERVHDLGLELRHIELRGK